MPQVKKLSVATVFGKIKLSELMQAKEMPVMRVYGVATGTKKGTTNFGDYTALIGQFRAIHPATGETNDANILFLPDIALVPIVSALSSGAQGVEFAIEVRAVYVAEREGFKAGGSPYEYTYVPLVPIGGDDVLARLESKMKAALPAPETKEETPAETGKGKGKK